jgi:hypothetical protein
MGVIACQTIHGLHLRLRGVYHQRLALLRTLPGLRCMRGKRGNQPVPELTLWSRRLWGSGGSRLFLDAFWRCNNTRHNGYPPGVQGACFYD